MDIKQLTGIVTDNTEEFKSILRRLSYIGVKGSQEYVSELLEHLAVHTLAKLPSGTHSTQEILEKLNTLLEFQFDFEPLLSALRRLEKKDEVFSTGGEKDENVRFGLVPDSYSNLWKEFREQKSFETQVFEDWMIEVEIRNPDLSSEDKEILINDLNAFSFRLYSIHSIESVSLFFGDQDIMRELLNQMGGDTLGDILPKRSERLNKIRNNELPRFFLDASIDRKKYIGQQLNSVFLLHMMQQDPKCAEIVKETIPGGTIFLDTNVLYALFGLNGKNLQDATERLIKLSRGLGYTPVVSPRTIEEYKYSININKNTFSTYPMITPELAKAALSTTYLDDVHTYFWKRSIDTKGYLSASGFYEIFTNIDALLEHYDIQVDDEFDEYIRSQEEKVAKEEAFLQSSVPEKYSDTVVKHDAHMRLLVLSFREGHEEQSPLETSCWLLTRDNLLAKYDRIARPKDSLKVPYCVLTSHWMQLLRPYSAAVEGYEITLAENLNSPLLRMFKLPQPEMIQEIITRMSQIDNVPLDIMIKSLTNKTFTDAFASERKEKERDELYQNHLASEIERIDQEKKLLSNEVKELSQTHSQINAELTDAIEKLKKSALQQNELVETKNKLTTELNDMRSGQVQLSGKYKRLTNILAETEEKLKYINNDKNKLENLIEDLTKAENKKARELEAMEQKYERETRQHQKFLENVKAEQLKRKNNNRIIYTWLISSLFIVGIRPWELQGSWMWLTFTLILVPLIITQFILLYKKGVSALYAAILFFFNLLAFTYSLVLLFGLNFSNSFTYVVGGAEILGVLFAVFFHYEKTKQEKPKQKEHSIDKPSSSKATTIISSKILKDDRVEGKSPWEALGDEAYNEKRYDAAIEAYRKANAGNKLKQVKEVKLKLEIEQLVRETQSYENQGKWDEASQGYQQLLEWDSDNLNWKKALDKAEEEIWLSKAFDKAETLIKEKKYKLAERTLQSIVQIRHDYKNTKKLLGRAQRKGSPREIRVINFKKYRKPISSVLIIAIILLIPIGGYIDTAIKNNSRVVQQNIILRTQTAPTKIALSNIPDARYFLKEDFNSNIQGWSLGKYSNDSIDETTEITNGKLRLSMRTKQSAFYQEVLPEVSIKNFIVSFDATISQLSGSDGGIGFIFRKQENGDFYVTVFRIDGSYGLYHFSAENSEWDTLYSDSRNDVICLEKGVTNNFSVAVFDSTYTIYANGIKLATVDDTTILNTGSIGLALELPSAKQFIRTEFDDLFLFEELQ